MGSPLAHRTNTILPQAGADPSLGFLECFIPHATSTPQVPISLLALLPVTICVIIDEWFDLSRLSSHLLSEKVELDELWGSLPVFLALVFPSTHHLYFTGPQPPQTHTYHHGSVSCLPVCLQRPQSTYKTQAEISSHQYSICHWNSQLSLSTWKADRKG